MHLALPHTFKYICFIYPYPQILVCPYHFLLIEIGIKGLHTENLNTTSSPFVPLVTKINEWGEPRFKQQQ